MYIYVIVDIETGDIRGCDMSPRVEEPMQICDPNADNPEELIDIMETGNYVGVVLDEEELAEAMAGSAIERMPNSKEENLIRIRNDSSLDAPWVRRNIKVTMQDGKPKISVRGSEVTDRILDSVFDGKAARDRSAVRAVIARKKEVS